MTYDVTNELADIQLDPAHPAVTPLPYAEAAIRKAVALAVGRGSTCWSDMAGTGVFDDQAALEVVEVTVAAIIDAVELGHPHLGCATTAQVREELDCRLRFGAPHSDDDYRTVG